MTRSMLVASFRMLDKNTGLMKMGWDEALSNDSTLVQVFLEAANVHPRNLVMDFHSISHLDGSSVALLISCIARMRHKDIRLMAYGLDRQLFAIFNLMGLTSRVELFSDPKDLSDAIECDVSSLKSFRVTKRSTKPPGRWADPVERFMLNYLPANALPFNLLDRAPSGPLGGFGQLWQKTFRVVIPNTGKTPKQVIDRWKKEFPLYWPEGNIFFGSDEGITPGEVAVLHLSGPRGMNYPGGLPFIATGVMVVYCDDDSFTFLSVEGHMIAGMITFSAREEPQGSLVIQMQALGRASDPLYELVFRLGIGHALENTFWLKTLANLAERHGASVTPEYAIEYLDRRMQWAGAGKIWKNAAVRSFFYMLFTPFRWVGRFFRK